MKLFVLATPADVSLLMQLGVDGVFVGSGIFKSSNPPERAQAMAQAVTHYKDPAILSEISSGLGEAMFGTPAADIEPKKTIGRGSRRAPTNMECNSWCKMNPPNIF